MKNFKLNDGMVIPAVGFGTFKIQEEDEMDIAISTALEAGYTYFDTASYYDNEHLVGKFLMNSGKKREDYRIATKVWPNSYETDKCKKSIDNSLNALDTDYIDILLLHRFGEDFDKAWKVFEEYKKQGIIKSIGVCNFSIDQMKKLLKVGQKPSVDQLESHLYLQDTDTKNFLEENNILHQARGPLTQGKSDLLDEKILNEIAKKYNKTPAQIVLKRNITRDTMVLVKSINKGRIKENIDVFDFELTKEDMHALSSLDKKQRFSSDPEDKEWLKKMKDM